MYDIRKSPRFIPERALYFSNSAYPSCKSCCEQALRDIVQAKEDLENGVTLDAVNVTVDSAIDSLLVLTGEKASDSVINEIFSRFCVGK